MKTLFKIQDKNGKIYEVKNVYTFVYYTFYLVKTWAKTFSIWHEHGLNASGWMVGNNDTIKELEKFTESAVEFLHKKDYKELQKNFSDGAKSFPISII